jgi:hypothetical protein
VQAVSMWVASLAVLVSLNQSGPQPLQQSGPQPFRHDAWDRVVRTYVTPAGLVRYGSLKAHPEDLVQYVDLLAKYSPDTAPQLFPTEADRLAYWINAYNAEIVNRVVANYPVHSIRDLGSMLSSVFKKTQTIGGKVVSHDDIEHGIIRKRFHEPRIHFVLNCASRSCAPLRRQAMTAETLESSLQAAAVNFMNDPRNVRLQPDSGTVELSKYFDWFPEDFLNWVNEKHGVPRPTVLDFVKVYVKPDTRALLAKRTDWRIRFFDYDWSLNDARDDGAAGPHTSRR